MGGSRTPPKCLSTERRRLEQVQIVAHVAKDTPGVGYAQPAVREDQPLVEFTAADRVVPYDELPVDIS